jgi:hypothetical protein
MHPLTGSMSPKSSGSRKISRWRGFASDLRRARVNGKPLPYCRNAICPEAHPLKFPSLLLDAGAEACFQFAWSAGRDRKNLPLVKPIIIDLVGITLGFVALYFSVPLAQSVSVT